MQYEYFQIKNFKGIQSQRFELFQKPHASVFLLIGLNESGKTTILEALSFYYDNIIKEKELTLRPSVTDDVHTLIPKGLRDNFNGDIEIEAGFILENEDKIKLSTLFESKGSKITSIDDSFSINLKLPFENSNFKEKKITWGIIIEFQETAESPTTTLLANHILFQESWNLINELIPPLIYYPNFLFDFPNRIYLQNLPPEDKLNKGQTFYKRVLQDVLDSLENDLDMDTHMVMRALSTEPKDRDSLDSVINKISGQLTRYILNNDYGVFGTRKGHREIIVTYPRLDKNNLLYVELKIKEGQDSFYVSERSLGFKWFFTFLLFTQFRLKRSSGTTKIYYLFDEPASNLHQSAQERLLVALDTLTTKSQVSIIYTTHSHHLINPKWLESSYIVRNLSLTLH